MFGNMSNHLQKVQDWLFGYDFFISYRWEDGRKYASLLAERLCGNYSCFLDSSEYAAADDVVLIGNRALRETSRLLLVATLGVAQSKHVKRELQIYKQSGKKIIAIGFDGSIDQLRELDKDFSKSLSLNLLHLEESAIALETGPSDYVLGEVIRSLGTELKRERRKRAIATVGSALLFFLLVLTVMAWFIRERVRYENARSLLLTALNASAEGIESGDLKITIDRRHHPGSTDAIDIEQLVDCCKILGNVNKLQILNCDVINADALAHLTNLEYLNLYHSRGIVSFAFLAPLHNVERILLDSTALDDEGLHGLEIPLSVQQLKLTNNPITTKGFATIASQLTNLRNLSDISVYGCRNLQVTLEQAEQLVKHFEQLDKERSGSLHLDLGKTDTSLLAQSPELLDRFDKLKSKGHDINGLSSSFVKPLFNGR